MRRGGVDPALLLQFEQQGPRGHVFELTLVVRHSRARPVPAESIATPPWFRRSKLEPGAAVLAKRAAWSVVGKFIADEFGRGPTESAKVGLFLRRSLGFGRHNHRAL